MRKELIERISSYEPPDLVGAWTGIWGEIYNHDGEFIMMALNVSHPNVLSGAQHFTRSFHRPTRDECIEAFGLWLDRLSETDTIR